MARKEERRRMQRRGEDAIEAQRERVEPNRVKRNQYGQWLTA